MNFKEWLTSPTAQKILIGELSWTRLLKSVVFVYVFFAGYVFFRADSMIFLPPPSSYTESENILKLNTPDQEKIAAIYRPNPEATYTILYIHGNAEDLGLIEFVLDVLYNMGFSVFAYDYRGYGLSEGKPSEQNAYEDAQTAYDYLTQELEIDPEKIIVLGRSVGGGSAVHLAKHQPVGGLILESTFTSAFKVVMPIPLLPFDKFRNAAKITDINVPILFIHGKEDTVIPFSHSQKLYDIANPPKFFLGVENANHNDVMWVGGDVYQKKIQEFQKAVTSYHKDKNADSFNTNGGKAR